MVASTRFNAADIGTLFAQDDRSIVEKYGMNAAPFFRLEISDQSDQVLWTAESQLVDGAYDLNGLIVSNVEWDENDCQVSMLSLTVQNIDLTLHDNRMFAEGNSIDLWMGYDGHTPDYMGRGIIVELEPDFPRSGIPSLGIKAYDIAHFMMEQGVAEIVPEGTAWFERNSQTVPSSSDATGVATNQVRDTDAQARDESSERGGGGPASGVSMDENGRSLDVSQRPVTFSRTDASPSAESTQERRTSNWQQARIPRQRRGAGKVWRELGDDEIAAAIFESYGIVPFTEATDQRSRATVENREITRLVISGDDVPDTTRQLNQRLNAERQGIIAQGQTPRMTVDDQLAQLERAGGLSQRETRLTATRETATIQARVGGRRVVQKNGTSDWEFIKKLAKNHGYIVFVFYHKQAGRWIGFWGPPNAVPQNVEYTFEYNRNDSSSLGGVRPKISMRGQKTEIDLMFTDPRSGREQRIRVSMDNINQYSSEFRGPDGAQQIQDPLGNGPEVVLTIHGQRVTTVADRNFTDPEDARRWLMAFWFRNASDFCLLEGDTIIGLPEMRARQRHNIEGIGRTSGLFFITKTTHAMGNGAYTCKFHGYRVVDMLLGTPDEEDENLTVDENAIGQLTPEAEEVINRWQTALQTQ